MGGRLQTLIEKLNQTIFVRVQFSPFLPKFKFSSHLISDWLHLMTSLLPCILLAAFQIKLDDYWLLYYAGSAWVFCMQGNWHALENLSALVCTWKMSHLVFTGCREYSDIPKYLNILQWIYSYSSHFICGIHSDVYLASL